MEPLFHYGASPRGDAKGCGMGGTAISTLVPGRGDSVDLRDYSTMVGLKPRQTKEASPR